MTATSQRNGTVRLFLHHLAAVGVLLTCAAAGARAGDVPERPRRRGTKLFFRMVALKTNAAVLPKTRSIWTQDRQVRTGTTGMSDHGFTEYPFCFGTMDFTFAQHCAVYPRLVSGAKADESIVNTADILIDHVYEPDGCVWGWPGREFVQTFTATQSELVGITLLVASEPGTFRAALLEGGPGGRQVGGSKTFTSGHSMAWGTACWEAGQAPLKPGQTYAIRIRREDGRPWTPYLHATGDAYDGGLLYVDGRPCAGSDLAVRIVEEPPDLKRALIDGADEHGWVYRCKRVTFTPRTLNVRLISLTVSPVTRKDLRDGYCDLVARVWSAEGKLLAGPKRCLSHGPRGGAHTAHFLFAADELRVEPGRQYHVDVYSVPHKRKDLPKGADAVIRPRDIRARVYGEPQPGALPAIFNLAAGFESDSRLKLSWSQPFPCPTRIEIRGPGVNDGKRLELPKGTARVVIPKFWAGHEYDIRLSAVGPTGLIWRTPLYRLRMPRGTEIAPIRQEQYPEQFVPLAPARRAAAPEYGPLRYQRQVPVVNGDFEEMLTGWRTDGPDPIRATQSFRGVGVKWGRTMAGWSRLGGKERRQVFATSTISQRIPTIPGHVYVLSGWAHTSVVGGPRGDTRVRLVADPAGGRDFEGINTTQWYWTDGRWMRFQHRWVARADRSTIGFGFFRWRDLDRASAYVDHATVYDLGPSPAEPGDGAARTRPAPSLVLADPRMEAEDRVEAYLQAPPGFVITGIGSRAHYDNVTTMWLRVQPLLADGTLGRPEELRGGWEPDAGLEAQVALPPGYVATGFGARAAPEWDVKTLVVWARPLRKDGTLGQEKVFRAGVEPDKGPERHVNLEAGRVLTAAGLNCMHNDIDRIRARSAVLVRTAAAEAESE